MTFTSVITYFYDLCLMTSKPSFDLIQPGFEHRTLHKKLKNKFLLYTYHLLDHDWDPKLPQGF